MSGPGGRAAIAGYGAALPHDVLTNRDLEARVDTTDAWIVERTGIRERRVASSDETTASLAVAAGKDAIKNARMVSGFGAGMTWASALLRWGAP